MDKLLAQSLSVVQTMVPQINLPPEEVSFFTFRQDRYILL